MERMEASPEAMIRMATGAWATAVLGSAVDSGVFSIVEEASGTCRDVAAAMGTSLRGTQALLDGLVGLGLLTVAGGCYANSPATSMFLVRGRPSYIGDWISFHAAEMREWARFGESVRTGAPVFPDADRAASVADLTLALAPLAVPVIVAAGERLGVAEAGPISILDVGGGSGVFSAFWLCANQKARSTQIDQARVNAVARRYVEAFGVANRFRTIDGDASALDWGSGEYDIGVFSHVSHTLGPEQNAGAMRKFRKALRTGGTLLIADFVLSDDRSGPPMALLFGVNMLVHTPHGGAWREGDYREWLAGAGFADVSIDRGSPPVALIYAR